MTTFGAILFASSILTSCGGSKEKDEMDITESLDSISAPTASSESNNSEKSEINLDEINSAKDAMSQYKDLIEKYAQLTKDGKLEDAKELKEQMDKLKSFAEGKWQGSSLKAMAELSEMAIQIEAGKVVDLGNALKAYDKALDAVKDLPGGEDAKDLLKASGDLINAANGLNALTPDE